MRPNGQNSLTGLIQEKLPVVYFACQRATNQNTTQKVTQFKRPLHIVPQHFLLQGTSASAHRICVVASALVAVSQFGELIWPDITSGPLVGDVP
jgi:hypothetical protein